MMEHTQSEAICFFNTNKQWGGGEKWHLEMAMALQKEKSNVVIIASGNSPLYEKAREKGMRVYAFRISNLSFLNPLTGRKLKHFFRKNGIDVVVMNLPSDLKVAAPAAKKAGVRKIIYRRGSAIPVKDTVLNRYYFRKFLTDVIANSFETRRTLLQNNPDLIERKKIHVIYNGIHPERYDAKLPDGPEKSNKSRIILGNAGRLTEQKGHKDLIRIVEILTGRGIAVELKIAGDGPLRRELEAIVIEKKLQDNIRFMGFVNDIPGFLHSLDIFLLSSRWEGFGYVIAEAMACAKPVLAYNVSSSPELIKEGETGFLIEPFNVEKFVSRVEVMIKDPVMRKKLGENGRRRVKENFTFEKSYHEFRSLIFNQH